MNIDDLTLGEIKQLREMFANPIPTQGARGLNSLVGRKVIIRTYAAGVHYGELIEKEGGEVILKNARRLWYWKTANNGISLSEVANFGLHKDSKVCAAIELQWLEAIEIIPCSKDGIKSIEAQNDYKA